MKKIYYILGGIVLTILLTLIVLLVVSIAQPKVQELGGRMNYQERTMLDEVATTTWSSAFNVADYQHVDLTVATTAATSTVTVACSMQQLEPTFSSVASATNRWDYVQVLDYENGASIDGDTGVVFAGATEVRLLELNINNARWCSVYNNRTTGTTTVKLLGATNW